MILELLKVKHEITRKGVAAQIHRDLRAQYMRSGGGGSLIGYSSILVCPNNNAQTSVKATKT